MNKIITPHKGFQERFVRSSLDIVFAGGQGGGGKSAAMVMDSAYHIDRPEYRALYIRKTLSELAAGGGLVDEFKLLYPKKLIESITTSESPEVTFKGGAKAILTHMQDNNLDKLQERVKGWQYDTIYMDELTGYSYTTFTYLLSRLRGSSGAQPYFRGTTNPKKNSWVRKFIDWYVDEEGHIDPLKDGKVRYFFNEGNTPEEVIWGDSKEEVYMKAKNTIDRYLRLAEGKVDISYENLIKSFTFYSGSIFDNQTLLERDPNYVGNLAATGGASADRLLGGNWNRDDDEQEQIPIPVNKALTIFDNDANPTNDKYITVDPAGEGENNMVMVIWYGFHVQDILILSTSTPAEVIRSIQIQQEKHDIGNMRVIYDGVSIGDYLRVIPGAISFKGGVSATASGKHRFADLKTQCATKLIELIDEKIISIERSVAERLYLHQNIKQRMTIRDQIVNELGVLRYDKPMPSGKLKLINKRIMTRMLGKGLSTDIMDNFIMRMYPALNLNAVILNNKDLRDSINRGKASDEYVELDDFLNW